MLKSFPLLSSLVCVCAACSQSPSSDLANTVLVSISGERAATVGFAFPPGSGAEALYFLDGWDVRFEHAIVTIGNVSLSEGPNTSPSDPSVVGPTVAEAAGPWAVDLAGSGALDAKEGNGKAIPLTRLLAQNKQPGSPAFDSSSQYAFGYDLLPAALSAQDVNLDVEAEAAYQLMAERGWTVWLKGVATWKGNDCRVSDTQYDFGRVPHTIDFAFGFAMPVKYRNCENPELQPMGSRGLQTQNNTETVAQITLHLDHAFWEALEEDAPLRWDAIAAQKSVASSPAARTGVTEANLDFDFQSVHDAQNQPLPWRTCGPTVPQERTQGTVAYNPVNVPVTPVGGSAGLKNLGEYMRYNLSTFGHFNNDGLCFPERQYPSPP